MLKIGAHLSISGGYGKALEKAKEISADCLQIFSASPRSWQKPKVGEKEINDFIVRKQALGIEPVYFHASYLINLADNGRVGALSREFLAVELILADKLGIKGSIVHLGSYKENDIKEGYRVLIKNLEEVLKEIPKEIFLLIENAGNHKIGVSLEEIGKIIADLRDKRVKICLDTCHLHAAGFDLSSREKLDDFLLTFDKIVGLERLKVWHLNDSRDPLGSFRDRHDNIGRGSLGLNSFREILNHPQFKDLPFIIETPGFDQKGPDKRNLDILKDLVD
jgi:deoxyribonuclease-4